MTRIGKRDILPLEVKFNLQQIYDRSDGKYKFKDTTGTAIMTIDPVAGTITFGIDLTLANNLTITGNLTNTGNLTHFVLMESGFGSELTTGGTPSASVENQPSEGSDEAFDDDPVTKWLATGSSTPWIQYQFTSSKIVKKYTLTMAEDFRDRDPRSWQFQGSNNGTDFTTLQTVTDYWFGSRSIRKDFYINNSTAYTYYRINITANWGSADTQIAEIQMFAAA